MSSSMNREATISPFPASRGVVTRYVEVRKTRKDLEKRNAELITKLALAGNPAAISDAINDELSKLSDLSGTSGAAPSGDPVR